MDKLITLWSNIRYSCTSEPETITKIIEPILQELGWNIQNSNEVLKVYSLSQSDVDIRLFESGNIRAAIECKALHSNEFKIYEGLGDIELNSETGKYKNTDKDGIGQLRRYCMDYKNSGMLSEKFLPIITNGLRWVIFEGSQFLEECSLSQPINSKMIIFDEVMIIENFLSDISVYLSKS